MYIGVAIGGRERERLREHVLLLKNFIYGGGTQALELLDIGIYHAVLYVAVAGLCLKPSKKSNCRAI